MAENAEDGEKTVAVLGGRGGSGGAGRASNDGLSGSGGDGGNGGAASGAAVVNVDVPSQIVSVTASGGFPGSGGSAGGGVSMNFGGGGDGGGGGDASASVDMTAGAATTLQNATVSVNGAGGANGGNGVLADVAQQGGAPGQGGRGGLATGTVLMRGSGATTTQNININIRGGANGVHGTGAGLPLFVVPPAREVNAVSTFDVSTPADGAAIGLNASIVGGNGHDVLASAGGFPASGALLNASRIEAAGVNSRITFGVFVSGGGAPGWLAPTGLGATFIQPDTLGEGSNGAEPSMEPVEMSAGPGGQITASVTLAGGNGGHRTGEVRAGNGAGVNIPSDVVRAVSQGGRIILSLTGNGGNQGVNSQGTDGLGGDVTLVNTLAAETSGDLHLTQIANGGQGGGQAVSTQERESASTGLFTVITRATGGTNASFDPPELALDSPLGSAKATSIARGAGANTQSEATARGQSAVDALKGADAEAFASATGPSRPLATASAEGGDAVTDGTPHATAHAEVTGPGTPALATAGVRGLTGGTTEATAVSHGALISPVAEMSAYCFGENLAAKGQDAPTHAAVASGAGIGLLTGSFGLSGSHTLAVIDANPATVFSFGSLNTNPDVATFFAGLPEETHLVACRPMQRAGAVNYDGGRVVKRRYGGTFQLAPCLSGGQLVLSGLGHKSAAGALDGMAFTVRRDDTVLLETSDPALFTNTVTLLDDLALANATNVYRWEIVTTATSAEQTFEAYFAFSATAPVGLGSTQGAGAPLTMGPIRMTPVSDSDPAASPTLRLVSGSVTGGVPLTTLVLETTSDLGLVERWRPLRTFTFDATGSLTFEETIDLADPSASAAYFRFCRP
ncbi:MAG: hypothetical protein KDN22_25870 [Verrucomicrobiae bacterium]|nr:hypothetical protein [Verrucomicrobiae bacterium]